jgi:hypothetical protein
MVVNEAGGALSTPTRIDLFDFSGVRLLIRDRRILGVRHIFVVAPNLFNSPGKSASRLRVRSPKAVAGVRLSNFRITR